MITRMEMNYGERMGTSNGTMLVKDIYCGRTSSGIDSLAVLGSYVYFGAAGYGCSDDWTGDELWRSDGTSNGTTEVPILAMDMVPESITLPTCSPTTIHCSFEVKPERQVKSCGQVMGLQPVLPCIPIYELVHPEVFQRFLCRRFNNLLYFHRITPVVRCTSSYANLSWEGLLSSEDIYPGPNSGSPNDFIVAGNLIFLPQPMQ